MISMKSDFFTGRTIIIVVTIALIANHFVTVNTPMKTGSCIHRVEDEKQGSFFLTNTSLSEEFVNTRGVMTTVGTTWNLTFSVDGNSTAGVNITVIPPSGYPFILDWWEGEKTFIINPGEIVSVLYVSHAATDHSNSLQFHHMLVHDECNASGSYNLTLIDRGFVVDIKTGQTYISNITSWLDMISNNVDFTSSKVSIATEIYQSSGLTLFLLICSFVLIRKKRRELSE